MFKYDLINVKLLITCSIAWIWNCKTITNNIMLQQKKQMFLRTSIIVIGHYIFFIRLSYLKGIVVLFNN